MINGEMDVSAVSSVGSIDRKNVPQTIKGRIVAQCAWVRSTGWAPQRYPGTAGSEHMETLVYKGSVTQSVVQLFLVFLLLLVTRETKS